MKRAESRTGIALVDIVVGTVLLAITIAVLLGLLSRATANQTLGEQMQTAAMLIDEQLNLVLARGPDNYAARFPAEGVFEPPFDGFQYRLTFAGGSSGDPYRVTATVLWSAAGRPMSASVETLIAPRLGENTDPDRAPQQAVERTVGE